MLYNIMFLELQQQQQQQTNKQINKQNQSNGLSVFVCLFVLRV